MRHIQSYTCKNCTVLTKASRRCRKQSSVSYDGTAYIQRPTIKCSDSAFMASNLVSERPILYCLVFTHETKAAMSQMAGKEDAGRARNREVGRLMRVTGDGRTVRGVGLGSWGDPVKPHLPDTGEDKIYSIGVHKITEPPTFDDHN